MIKQKRYGHIDKETWTNWRWQLKNSITHFDDIRKVFPNLPEDEVALYQAYSSKYKFRLTPYVIDLMALDELGNPLPDDPIWRQFRYLFEQETNSGCDGSQREENWENPAEMPTRILQHKYPDRAIIRCTNSCMAHCNYCYLTSRVLDQEATKERTGNQEAWEASMAYLRAHPEIRDVLISGGDPLIFSNSKVEQMLRDLRNIKSIRTIRLNTRAFTFNPYRLDTELVQIFKTYQLTALEIHMCHYRELTADFDEQFSLFDSVGYRPLILWRAPLLKGVNDSEAVLETLFMGLYERRITPYYLFHYAPFTLGRAGQGVPIQVGSQLMKQLRRKVPGPAFPTYTLFHMEGKQDIPLDADGTRTFIYEEIDGKPYAKFENWRGHIVTYPDVEA